MEHTYFALEYKVLCIFLDGESNVLAHYFAPRFALFLDFRFSICIPLSYRAHPLPSLSATTAPSSSRIIFDEFKRKATVDVALEWASLPAGDKQEEGPGEPDQRIPCVTGHVTLAWSVGH